MHRARERLDDLRSLVKRLGLAADLLGEGAARKILEREIRQSLVFADLENPDEIGVLNGGDRFRLDLERARSSGRALTPPRIILKATNRSSRGCRAL